MCAGPTHHVHGVGQEVRQGVQGTLQYLGFPQVCLLCTIAMSQASDTGRALTKGLLRSISRERSLWWSSTMQSWQGAPSALFAALHLSGLTETRQADREERHLSMQLPVVDKSDACAGW